MSVSNEKILSVSKNASDTAALVWSVADDLVGAYKPHEYGLVILPMTVIKRFHDCLLPTHQAVLDTYKKVEKLAVKDGFLRKASGYQFYNKIPSSEEAFRSASIVCSSSAPFNTISVSGCAFEKEDLAGLYWSSHMIQN